MPPRKRVPPSESTKALILGGLVLGLFLWAGHRLPRKAESGQSPPASETASPAAPIPNAAEAIRRSVEIFPPRRNPHGEIARLVSNLTFEMWAANGVPGVLSAPEPDMFDWEGADPLSPVWLVGILGTDLTVDQVLAVNRPGGVVLTDKRPALGAFYAWDANSAELLVQGALISGAAQTYASLAAMANAALTPRAATPWPTSPLVTPAPTGTWSPAQLATGIAWATTVARGTP